MASKHDCIQQVNIALIQQEMENINEKLDSICKKLDTMDENLEKKFARKWVESAWVWLIITTGGVCLAALLKLIIK